MLFSADALVKLGRHYGENYGSGNKDTIQENRVTDTLQASTVTQLSRVVKYF